MYNSILADLGLAERFGYIHIGERRIGRFECIALPAKVSLKCACRLHPKCSLWIDAKGHWQERTRLALEWLKAGAAGEGQSAEVHSTNARDIKIGLGMKVRARG